MTSGATARCCASSRTRRSSARSSTRRAHAGGWVDSMRVLTPEPKKLYTWWSYRSADWVTADKGRRLDHIWVSPALGDRVSTIEITKAARGWQRPSDHVPVTATIESLTICFCGEIPRLVSAAADLADIESHGALCRSASLIMRVRPRATAISSRSRARDMRVPLQHLEEQRARDAHHRGGLGRRSRSSAAAFPPAATSRRPVSRAAVRRAACCRGRWHAGRRPPRQSRRRPASPSRNSTSPFCERRLSAPIASTRSASRPSSARIGTCSSSAMSSSIAHASAE